MTTEDTTPGRAGMYLKVETRNRLNLFKAALTVQTGEFFSQDDAINWLLDRYAADVQDRTDAAIFSSTPA